MKERFKIEKIYKASEIIKAKLKECGGSVIVESIDGNKYEIKAAPRDKAFTCDQLAISPPYKYEVFDVIVDLLVKEGGKAQKGGGRNPKIGEPNCDETTVIGAIGMKYHGKNYGQSTFDPVFVLGAVLDWAEIAHNQVEYLELME